MSDPCLLGGCTGVVVEPYRNGEMAMIAFELGKPVVIDGSTRKHAGVMLDGLRLIELVQGLMKVACVREARKNPLIWTPKPTRI